MAKYTLKTASNMSAETRASLEARLREKFKITDEIENVTDDSILGGFVFLSGSLAFDCSLETQLEEMKNFIKNKN